MIKIEKPQKKIGRTNKIDLQYYKKQLEKEKSRLEKELKTVAKVNPNNLDDWEPIPTKLDADPADEADVANKIDSFEENSSVVNELEVRLKDVNDALERIKKGIYGICQKGGEQIEIDRLKANFAAKTCIKHM